MAEDNSFYVGLKDPNTVRKEILISSKEIIGLLKKYDHINEIRTKKIEKITELNKVIADIKKLTNTFRSKLPATKLKGEKAKPEKKNISSAKKKSRIRTKKSTSEDLKKDDSTEVKALERELSEIESRLAKMGV